MCEKADVLDAGFVFDYRYGTYVNAEEGALHLFRSSRLTMRKS